MGVMSGEIAALVAAYDAEYRTIVDLIDEVRDEWQDWIAGQHFGIRIHSDGKEHDSSCVCCCIDCGEYDEMTLGEFMKYRGELEHGRA